METLALTWQAAIAIIVGIMTVTFGAISIAKVLKNRSAESISKEIESLETELKALENKLAEMQVTLDGKVGIQIQNIDNQIVDIKTTITRLQDKLEKLTDIIIKNFSSRGEN